MRFVLFVSLLLVVGCNSHKKKVASVEKASGLKKTIPLSPRGKPYAYYRNKFLLEKGLGLSSLENGFDSIELRLTYQYSASDSAYMIIIRRQRDLWNGELIGFWYGSNSGLTIKSENRKMLIPKHGWHNMDRKLRTSRFLELPSDSEISGYPEVVDGSGITIEFATTDRYKIYSFWEPGYAAQEIREAKTVVEMLEYLDEEFNVTFSKRL